MKILRIAFLSIFVATFNLASVTGESSLENKTFQYEETTRITTEFSASETTLVSTVENPTESNNDSAAPVVSSDGRYIVFKSDASNLVSGDTNGATDIFLHDRQTGVTSRVSVASDGSEANADSDYPAISADGRYIGFQTRATNLVPSDTNEAMDVFMHDRITGITTRVSVASDGSEGAYHIGNSGYPSISADGRFVSFLSGANNFCTGDTNNSYDIFVHDNLTGETTRVSVASDGSQSVGGNANYPVLSADGRYVAFVSDAANLVDGDTNGQYDVFRHDRQTGQTIRVSVASDGAQADQTVSHPAISADGRYIVFDSYASTLVPDDTNGVYDVFLHDVLTGQTTRVSVAPDGTQITDGHSQYPSISGNGRYIAFESSSNTLIPDDTNLYSDIFLHDRLTGETILISTASDGTHGDHISERPAIADTGCFISFYSLADNLTPNETIGAILNLFLKEFTEGYQSTYLPLLLQP